MCCIFSSAKGSECAVYSPLLKAVYIVCCIFSSAKGSECVVWFPLLKAVSVLYVFLC